MSKTPRTDEQIHSKMFYGPNDFLVPEEFAQKLETELAEARADVKDRDNALAAIMAVLPDSAKPCDAPDLIKHFKSQMSAFGSEYTRIEKQLKEARDEIERLKSEHEDSLRRAKDNAVSLSGTVTEYAGELLAKDKQLAEARAEIERLKKALEKIIYYTAQQYYRESEKHVRITNKIAKTALKAERGDQ